MFLKHTIFVVLFSFISFLMCFSQKPTRFDKILPIHFTANFPNIDSTAPAVIIAEFGSASYEANKKESFSLMFNTYRRIRINNPSAYDLATIQIPLFGINGGREEILLKLEAAVYNLENGNIIKTPLNKKDIFTDKKTNGLVIKKATLQNVKAGSIIEYFYSTQSDFVFNLPAWNFQNDYPTIWSEYETQIPSFYKFGKLVKGHLPFVIDTLLEREKRYVLNREWKGIWGEMNIVDYTSKDKLYRWAVENAPAIKLEPYTTTLSNHIQHVSFQLLGQQFPGKEYISLLDDWDVASTKLINSGFFGKRLFEENDWAKKVTKKIVDSCKTPLEKAKKLFNYVKNKYKCNNENAGINLSTAMEFVILDNKGTVADLNLLLVCLLNNEGLKANPVILSTIGNGKVNSQIPLLSYYNYVICNVIIDDESYLLDASNPLNGFNKLPYKCYNDSLILFNEMGASTFTLSADSLIEKKSTVINIALSKTNKDQWLGNVNSNLGYYESLDLRTIENKSGEAEAKKQILDQFASPYGAKNVIFSDFKNYDVPAMVNYNFTIDLEENRDLLYLNPLIKERTFNNYFKNDIRSYPVEMPFKMDENILAIIEIPEGYVLDEVPQNLKINMKNNKASFNYIVDVKGQLITIGTRIKFNQANFKVDDYGDLRSFMDFVVKKHAEQLVFKKK